MKKKKSQNPSKKEEEREPKNQQTEKEYTQVEEPKS